MRNKEHERERERDQTHSYWYIPSAPRVNYSLLVMESAGMMKMATGEGSPFGRVPERAPERFLVATKACSGGTPDLGYFLEVSVFIGIFGVRNKSGGSSSHPRDRASRPRVGRTPTLVDGSGLFWPNSFTPGASFGP